MPASGDRMMANGDPNYAIGVLTTRVAGIEQQFTALSGEIGKLSVKLDEQAAGFAERGRVNWIAIGGLFFAAVGTSVTTIAILGALARAPLDQGIVDLKETGRSLASSVATLRESAVPRSEFEEFKRTYEANRSNFKLDNNATLAALREAIAKVEEQARADRSAVVPRGEHQERWRAQDAGLAAGRDEARANAAHLQRQIDDLKSALGGIYGARDVILDLRERLDRTERALQDVMQSGRR